MMLLPPILSQVKTAFGVGYTHMAVALTVFSGCSILLQTPAGFLVDRLGPRRVLLGGLLLGSAALIAAVLLASYWSFILAYALLGVANTAYHPANYSILSGAVDPRRIGRAYSLHTFSGYLGFAVTPVMMAAVSTFGGWQSALVLAAGLSLLVALLLLGTSGLLPGSPPAVPAAPQPGPNAEAPKSGFEVLLSAPILGILFFYFCLGMTNSGMQTFTVVALGAIHGTPAATANLALSAYLGLTALGVLLGGILADRTPRHGSTAALALAGTATMAILMAWANLPDIVLVILMTVGGLTNGIMYPSRDMMVRAASPPDAVGRVFGFVSSGLYLGGMVAPLLYGRLMDVGRPRIVFTTVAAFFLLALVTAVWRAPTKKAPA
jgi:MFS family permease